MVLIYHLSRSDCLKRCRRVEISLHASRSPILANFVYSMTIVIRLATMDVSRYVFQYTKLAERMGGVLLQ
jgi:hypothetical protein